MYVKLDEENRIIGILNEDIDDREDLDEEGKAWLHEEFPVYVENADYALSVALHDGRDLVVQDGVARYDPLPESREKLAAEFREVIQAAKMNGLIEAVESMGLAALTQEKG